jgi:hypothetical protein
LVTGCGRNTGENRVLRKIFGPEREEVTEEWNLLHNKEFYGLLRLTKFYPGDQIMQNDNGGHVARMGVLVEKPKGKRLLVRPRRRWENNYLNRSSRSGMSWNGLIWLTIGTGGGLL